MMDPASEQQRAALVALKELFVTSNTPLPGGPALQPAQLLAEVALLLRLPNPATTAEAEEQMAALRTASLRAYAAAHATWAYPIMSRAQARVPDPAKIPDRQSSGAAWTPSAWRAYVEMILRVRDVGK